MVLGVRGGIHIVFGPVVESTGVDLMVSVV